MAQVYTLTPRQKAFMDAGADEVLFGGAAGGGKSYGQLIDALYYALRYPGSKQLILRRTFPELEKSLIRVAEQLYPAAAYRYNAARHMGKFCNGSLIDFGYCDSERDVTRYQSAEYDVIRFDELTHFTERMYTYLLSRLRGANPYPKQVKSATNPGGVGHAWVKARFIDALAPDEERRFAGGSRIYLPARVKDNRFLLDADPGYLRRLENLGQRDRQALLYGDWDLFEGQYFDEFRRDVHVVSPFAIPEDWTRYRTLDYGLDCLACYFIALSPEGRGVVYREIFESDLIISRAAERIRAATGAGERIRATFAPPDLWNRRQDTGRSAAEGFAAAGVGLTKADNRRVMGWYELKEWLHPGEAGPRLRIFPGCVKLIESLSSILADPDDPEDCARQPHELTHAPDALRYFVAGRPHPARPHRGERGLAAFLRYGG